MRRLGIFLFYDRDGQISDHVVYLLEKFSQHVERILFISNGRLADGQSERVAPYIERVIVRPNVGFDVGGYIDGLKAIGFDEIAQYDELVLFNYTVFGPIFDLREMFDEMASREVDLWGVTEYTDRNKQFIQSYFLVTRKRLHASADFREYWLNMPEINSVEDSIQIHEFRFTNFFVDRGFKKGVFVQNEPAWQGNTTLVDLPGLVNKRVPLIKYRAFNFDPRAIERRGGLPAAFNFETISSRTEYPVQLIWNYILSQSSSDQIIDSITGTRITADTGERSVSTQASDPGDLVVFLSIEQEEAVTEIFDYFAHLKFARFYLVSSKEQIVTSAKLHGWTVLHSSRPMTGVPIAAFREEILDLVSDEDVVFNLSCFAEERSDYYFRERATENYWGPLVSSTETVCKVRRQFDENPRVGLLFSPTNSVFGRIRRNEPLCPRASNWAFKTYPADVRLAPAQSRWPWRGNAALSGRLVRASGFVARLAELNGQMKIMASQKVSGSEGFMAELARQAGFASALVVSATQASKLATRHTVEERDARLFSAQHAEKHNREVAALRKALDDANAQRLELTAAIEALKTTSLSTTTEGQVSVVPPPERTPRGRAKSKALFSRFASSSFSRALLAFGYGRRDR